MGISSLNKSFKQKALVVFLSSDNVLGMTLSNHHTKL